MNIFIGETAMTTYVIPFVFLAGSISLLASLFTRSVMHQPATNSLVTLLARLIVMCITGRAQSYLSDNRSGKS